MNNHKNPPHIFSAVKQDASASLIVFLVALPLCLGIALASGAPLFSGLIAGIVGGIVVGGLSGSALGVSGPAAGLAVVVFTSIEILGTYEAFLLAVVWAGLFQIVMGLFRAGVIAQYFPSSVIHGMLAGIGVLIIFKQLPHALGYKVKASQSLIPQDDSLEEPLSWFFNFLDSISSNSIWISVGTLAILMLWQTRWMKSYRIFNLIQGPLVAVLLGIGLNWIFSKTSLALSGDQLVLVPGGEGLFSFVEHLRFPDFSQVFRPQIYTTALVLSLVASIETLLCVEASDKIDPFKRVTPIHRELKAQGIGNFISGLLGGLPITQVIIRSSTNAQAHAQTKLSTILHGCILFLTVVCFPNLLNKIPLSTLAVILCFIGFNLASPSVFRKIHKQGLEQWIPFITTLIFVVSIDLLVGVCLGFLVSLCFILYENLAHSVLVKKDTSSPKPCLTIELSEHMTFLKKASLLKILSEIPDGSTVTLDASRAKFIHPDVMEVLRNFQKNSETRSISLNWIEMNPLSCKYTSDMSQ